MKNRPKWFYIILAVCLIVFLFSSFMLARDLIRSSSEKSANRELVEQVRGEESETETPEERQAHRFEQYAVLHEQNSDLAGWLYIEGTDLDYPVMYTPDDPEYYLHRGFDKQYAASGCLFVGEGCTPDASHLIIYGHHMKNGSMFAGLVSYEDESYAREYPIIHYDTLTEAGQYEVMAAFYGKIYNQDQEDVFRYYQYGDLTTQEQFDEYVSQVKAAAIYDTGIQPQFGDKLITLSTCSYHTKNGRFVVVARKIPSDTDTSDVSDVPKEE